MSKLFRFCRRSMFPIVFLLCSACSHPRFVPQDLSQIRSPEELGLKSQQAYQDAKQSPDKNEKLKWAHAGISYSDKCLALAPRSTRCLYYRVLNTGVYIKNHIPNYQKGLRRMVADCESLIEIQADYEHGGCYRVLGNIYAQAPGFSLNPKNITQDLEKSVEYLKEAVKIAPNYPLNQLFLARSLEAVGDKDQARTHLQEFDRLASANLDSEYPDWKQDRDKLAQKLLHQLANSNP